MFSEMMAAPGRGGQPDPVRLRHWFRAALTKKLAVVRMPPAFWVRDPKINPRADHLLWAALLLDDREGVELAASIIAVEHAGQLAEDDLALETHLAAAAEELLALVPAGDRDRLRRQVDRLLAPPETGNHGESRSCRK